MQTGSYESSDDRGIGTAVTFLLIGLGAGALVGLLLAPKSGRQMRRHLRRKYENAIDNLQDMTETARDRAKDVMDRGSDMADDLKERVAPLGRGFRRS
jgi:gas vesicle protein